MPNTYATLKEIKQAMPDAIDTDTTKYDQILTRFANTFSRFIDDEIGLGRVFYPFSEIRTFDGQGSVDLWIDDAVGITTVEMSDDDGETYRTLTASDFIATVGGDYNHRQSFDMLLIDSNGDEGLWPRGTQSVRITAAAWGYSDDKDNAFEDTLDAVVDDPLDADATVITIASAAGVDLWGFAPRISIGNILRIDSEYIEVTGIVSDTSITVVRGRNGTTAAIHTAGTQIDKWRVAEVIKQAMIIQANREYERGRQGYGDTGMNAELGKMFITKEIDPEALRLLERLKRIRGADRDIVAVERQQRHIENRRGFSRNRGFDRGDRF